jgi:hypothetical protein
MPPNDRPTIIVTTKIRFSFLWCRSLTGACLAGERCCAQTLRGPYLSFLPGGAKGAGQTFSGSLDERGGQLWYLCGVVGGTANSHRNTHLIMRPGPLSRFNVEDDTIRVQVEGADPVPLPPLPTLVAARLTDRRRRCRCIWAAYNLFPACRVELTPDDSPSLFD